MEMNHLRCTVFLLLAPAWALGQPDHPSRPAGLPEEPGMLVQSLYRQVVARHPVGIPRGANRKIFEPYLSKTLLHEIELARSCADDWSRQNRGRILKAPFAWEESGLFSGANERTDPLTFQVERTELQKDGSSLVNVKLGGGAPPEKPWIWEVAARVVRENERPVIDDVTYLKGGELDTESRLTEVLAKGCNGSRWVGDRDAK
jgi:hypothetical protein